MRESGLLALLFLGLLLLPPSPDLALTSLTDTPDPVDLGSQVTYQLTLQNLGATEAKNVALTDTVSAGATFLSCVATSGGVCTISTENQARAAVSYSRLKPGASSTINLVAHIPTTLQPGTVIQNSARVSHKGGDRKRDNNAISATTVTRAPLIPTADLAVGVTAAPAEVVAGSLLTYTVTVTNAGPSPAVGVTVTDTLPPETSYSTCTATGGGVCGGAGNRRTVTFATLPVGARETVTLEATVVPTTSVGTEIPNIVRVGATSPGDNVASDNQAAATATVVAGDARGRIGEWTGPDPWPGIAIHLHVLPTGKVLAYDHRGAHVWDPASGQFQTLPPTSTNLFCSGHAFLPDGRLLVAGGHIEDGVGDIRVNLFDPVTQAWSQGPPMNAGRWYPSVTALANGELLVISGAINQTAGRNGVPQIWTANGTWRSLTNALDAQMALYPYMHLGPDGRVFQAGPGRNTRFLSTQGTGAWASGPPSAWGTRDYGTSVLYDEGKVLIAGGGQTAVTATAEVIDLSTGSGWRYTNPMSVPRRQHNATLLPDGKVLVTGGTSSAGFNNGSGAVMEAEMWDPVTEQWTTLASMSVRRLYHSTAVLLPDGRVLSAGGGRPPATGLNPPDTDHPDAEIYSPPYLFGSDGSPAVRPTITSAPAAVTYGQTFLVETPDPSRIARVTWVSLSSATHAFNMTQRLNRLTFATAAGGLNVTAPASGNMAPPGPYMLFLLDAAGVPSVAHSVNLR